VSELDLETKRALDAFCEHYQNDIPLVAVHTAQQRDSVEKLLYSHPSLKSTNYEAMLWLRLGLIDRAHEIVQSANRGISAYIHGIVHRLEGDFWNSKYWFRRVHDNRLFENLSDRVERAIGLPGFDPAIYTDTVEQFLQSRSPSSHAELSRIAIAEWNAVLAELQESGIS
jgi:hypothetical protein